MMSLSLGVLVGHVHALVSMGLNYTHLVMVAPSTWQAHQRQHEGVQLKRGAGIELALKVAEEAIGEQPFYKALAPVDKEGAASAFGIHNWWTHVMGQ